MNRPYPAHLRAWRVGEIRYAQFMRHGTPAPEGSEEIAHMHGHHGEYGRIVMWRSAPDA